MVDMSKPQILFASTNTNKIDIFSTSFEQLGLNKNFELLTLNNFPELKKIDVEEPGNSFKEDALIKAREYSKRSNLPTISQDRGFVFEALNWPGTKSKLVMDGDEKAHITFRSEADKPKSIKEKHRKNAQLALKKLEEIEDRTMNIYQAIAVCLPDGREIVDLHKCEGMASYEVVDTNDSSMTSFFIPKGYNTPMGGWSEVEIFDFDVKYRYPITSKIVEFLEKEVLE
jgi:non-canonical purine NTP pyrophosphatase (RdgB/HAM1 family)